MKFIKRFQASLESLYQLPENSQYIVAYSGGVDSHVLLYCCHQLNLPLRAVHVHHGLQSVADDWVKHCQHVCNQLSVPLEICYVDAKQQKGKSPEQSARKARYHVLHEKVYIGDCLLTAQHQNDQAETLLLQLFRTANTAGLAAMPASKKAADGVHLRPLLKFSRSEIEHFARDSNLQWVEDPSNQDTGYNRNLVRRKIIPLLENRWPEITSQLSMVASLQADNLQVLEDMAATDLAGVIRDSLEQTISYGYQLKSRLSSDGLKRLSSARMLNVLRYWIIKVISCQPTRNLLKEIEKTLINSQPDVKAVITFHGFEFRQYQDDLYLIRQVIDRSAFSIVKDKVMSWNPLTPLEIPAINARLRQLPCVAEGLTEELLTQPLRVGFRKGGERFHPANRQHSQSLKKLLQEAFIPPWEREYIPLLYLGDELIAIGELWISKQYAVDNDETGWQVVVEPLL